MWESNRSKNTQIDRAEVARCILLAISCSTDLDYCVVFVDRVGVFLEHVHRTLKASEQSTFACLLALVASNNRCNIHFTT